MKKIILKIMLLVFLPLSLHSQSVDYQDTFTEKAEVQSYLTRLLLLIQNFQIELKILREKEEALKESLILSEVALETYKKEFLTLQESQAQSVMDLQREIVSLQDYTLLLEKDLTMTQKRIVNLETQIEDLRILVEKQKELLENSKNEWIKPALIVGGVAFVAGGVLGLYLGSR